jgi:hypothetical protein
MVILGWMQGCIRFNIPQNCATFSLKFPAEITGNSNCDNTEVRMKDQGRSVR